MNQNLKLNQNLTLRGEDEPNLVTEECHYYSIYKRVVQKILINGHPDLSEGIKFLFFYQLLKGSAVIQQVSLKVTFGLNIKYAMGHSGQIALWWSGEAETSPKIVTQELEDLRP